jgi:hypothetical protein
MEQNQLKLVTEVELSELINRSVQTLRNDRHRHRGLPYIKIGRSIRYDLADVEAYLNECRVIPE